MPQTVDSSSYGISTPVQTQKQAPVFCRNTEETFDFFMKHGFVCFDIDILPPWNLVESMMRLDKETIDDVNACYNDKKIIKTSNYGDTDKKVAFDINNDRVEAMAQHGLLTRFPDFSNIMGYFDSSKNFLGSMAEKLNVKEYDLNYRMIDYQVGYGNCLPHRDFGLVTLIQQNCVGGLQVEYEGCMVDIPPEASVILAGWCLHLMTNGDVPAPLHQVCEPRTRRLSCVTFLAPSKDTVLRPQDQTLIRKYKDCGVKELKEMMAKRWRVREGTILDSTEGTSQDDLVFGELRLK